MQIIQTEVFEKDIEKIDGTMRKRLKDAIEKIARNPDTGKPLKQLKNVFSERVGNFRLIYKRENFRILLICFKNRDQVYEFANRRLE